MATEAELHGLLEEESTKKYHIEWMGPRANHMAHGIIALFRLGATKERMRRFAKICSDVLEPTRDTGDVTPLSDASMASLRGKHLQFNDVVRYYDKQLRDVYNDDVNKLIETEFSAKMDGLHASLLHPMIHVGYGLDVGSRLVILEGVRTCTTRTYRPTECRSCQPHNATSTHWTL